ncbi:MAG: hypothetical protein M0014_05330, partial [Actinomycetota bacterium]|nr:hypothetical protein [Actinomycetota bacterium]
MSFVSFLDEIHMTIVDDFAIDVVANHGSSGTSKATTAGLVAHPRCTVYDAAKPASWLDQVECLFSDLSPNVLRRGGFSSREHLVAKMTAFIAQHRGRPVQRVEDAKAAARSTFGELQGGGTSIGIEQGGG